MSYLATTKPRHAAAFSTEKRNATHFDDAIEAIKCRTAYVAHAYWTSAISLPVDHGQRAATRF